MVHTMANQEAEGWNTCTQLALSLATLQFIQAPSSWEDVSHIQGGSSPAMALCSNVLTGAPGVCHNPLGRSKFSQADSGHKPPPYVPPEAAVQDLTTAERGLLKCLQKLPWNIAGRPQQHVVLRPSWEQTAQAFFPGEGSRFSPVACRIGAKGGASRQCSNQLSIYSPAPLLWTQRAVKPVNDRADHRPLHEPILLTVLCDVTSNVCF